MYKKEVIDTINNQFDFDFPFDELLKKAEKRNIKIKKTKSKTTLISIGAILLVLTSVTLSFGLIHKKNKSSNSLILPGTIELLGNTYLTTEVIFNNSNYALETIGYVINIDEIENFETDYPEIEYYASKDIKSSVYNNRVPIYSIANYDVNSYIAVSIDNSLSKLYKTEKSEDLFL